MKRQYLEIKILDESFLPQILKLQDIVCNEPEVKSNELLLEESPEFFETYLTNRKEGFICGVLCGKDLVSFAVTYFPKDGDNNLGLDIGLPKEELKHVAHFSTKITHPDYRGKKISNELNQIRFPILSELDYYHICSTSSPFNAERFRPILDMGFVILNLKEKYGGVLRYISYRKLYNSVPVNFEVEEWVSSLNINRQKELLSQGFCGYQVKKFDSEVNVRYVPYDSDFLKKTGNENLKFNII